MSQLFSSSICVTDLVEKLKAGHSAFNKSPKNGKLYCNIKVWLNDEIDEYGNIISFQLNSTKEKRETEPAFYLGNGRRMEAKPINQTDIAGIDSVVKGADVLPTSTPITGSQDDGLPF